MMHPIYWLTLSIEHQIVKSASRLAADLAQLALAN
jgi:hypothetical protein